MAEQHQTNAARRSRERWREIRKVVFVVLLALLVGDLLCSLLVPILGLLQIVLLRNLLFPPPPLPDEVVAYSTSVTVWDGRVYARGILANTAVFDSQSGKLLSTMPGVVLGSDSQFLYVNTGKTAPGSTFDLNTLTARDSSENIIWSYMDDQFTLTLAQDYQRNIVAPPQLQSDADNVYVLEIKKTPVPRVGRLLALNRATGALRWSYDVTGAVRFVLAQDTLVLLSDKGLIAFTALDGRQLWQQPNSGWTNLVSDGRLLYLQNTLGMRALSLRTGRQAWMVSYKPQPPDAPFVLDGATVYLSEYTGKIIAVDTRDGRLLWRATIGDEHGAIAPLAAQNGVLYTYPPQFQAAYFNDSLSAISGANGHTLWKTPLQAHNLTLVGKAHGALYFTTGDESCGLNSPVCAQIFAINDQTGKQMWSQAEPQMDVAIPPQGQSLYVASFIHRNQVKSAWFGRYTYGPNCSDTVTLTSLSAVDGTVEWRQSVPFHCTRDIAN